MRHIINLLALFLVFTVSGCEKVSENAVDISVDFSWEGMEECGWGNPEVHFNGVPERTKSIQIKMYDHVYIMDHGKAVMPYTGNEVIPRGQFQKIQGPCPTSEPGRYEITIKALDENDVVIGKGSKERLFPEQG